MEVFENIGRNDERIVLLMIGIFRQAIGIYKKRIIDAINPFYWLEFIIFLPQNIIQYVLGNSAIPNWFIRLINVFYWLSGIVISIIKFIPYKL
jgi:hypothetical protein